MESFELHKEIEISQKLYLQNMTLSTLLILAVCRMHVIHEVCNGLANHRVSVAQW